jgi:hypothetical protein
MTQKAQKARDRSPHPLRAIPSWPSNRDLTSANANQLAFLGTYINTHYKPATPITAGTMQELIAQIMNFFLTDPAARDLQGQQDGLHPDDIAAGTPSPSQMQLAASGAVTAPTASAAATGSVAAPSSQQANLSDLAAKASAWVQEASNHICPVLLKCKALLGNILLLFFVVLVLFTCVQFCLQSPPQTYNVKNMTVSERWAIVRQSRINANLGIISCIVTMLKLAIMYTLGTIWNLSAWTCVFAAFWHHHRLFVFWPWVEFVVLCCVGKWPDGFLKSFVVVLVKYFFNVGNAITARLLTELAWYFLWNFASTNKTMQALMLPANMFLKSIVSSKETCMFLCTPAFTAPYKDKQHPFHPDYTDKVTGKKADYSRKRVNELLGMLGEPLGSNNVTQEHKIQLWQAHENNMTWQSIAWMLQMLIKLKP